MYLETFGCWLSLIHFIINNMNAFFKLTERPDSLIPNSAKRKNIFQLIRNVVGMSD